jgi:hypothetical protein
VRTVNYSDYLTGVTALIGIPIEGLHEQERSWLDAYFSKALRGAWEASNWLDLCPYSEARIPKNLVEYPSDYALGGWLLNGVTIDTVKISNPLDGRRNAQRLLETATNSPHAINITFPNPLPNTQYVYHGYVHAFNREWVYITASDGIQAVTAFFNIRLGTLGTITTLTGLGVAAIKPLAGGWYEIAVTMTSHADAGYLPGGITVGTSVNGSLLSELGDPTRGFQAFGITITPNNPPGPNSFFIPWEQPGEHTIDAVFEVWGTNPNGFLPGARSAYQLTDYGIQFICTTWPSPVWLYYRVACPSVRATTYNPVLPYGTGRRVRFTNAQGIINIYTAKALILPGQSPDSLPALWELLEIPFLFLDYLIQQAFGDWLAMDGQADKAAAAYGYARTFLDDQLDKQERQMGYVAPIKISTHLTSQNRGLGMAAQSNQPGFPNGLGFGF